LITENHLFFYTLGNPAGFNLQVLWRFYAMLQFEEANFFCAFFKLNSVLFSFFLTVQACVRCMSTLGCIMETMCYICLKNNCKKSGG